ncbi:CPBP family intramembrane glutamic endopeptidase [Oceanivirga salmonicida]|uniref:CPBP family intramembrane glutamic endopeptidase n=1 Tax=Oceanivirga salmonicida TaxID=1769291 RepID=UPI0012E1AAA9|nr:CPBP family intramembrane glutamic endopeptidase [Oceanivirga salmonicida]
MEKNKIQYLRYYDIIFITIIMFGIAIYSSILDYKDIIYGVSNINENLYFSSTEDWVSIIIEIFELFIVFVYLYFRKFDFSKWKFKMGLKTILKGILIYIVASLIIDISSFVFSFNQFPLVYTGQFIAVSEFIKEFSISLIPFSILNGFFEEIFFLGICLSVKEKYIKYALIYSMIIRVSFHTYQGMASAMTIGIGIGLLFYVAYTKYSNKNLAPVVIAHIISDIFGAGIIGFLVY